MAERHAKAYSDYEWGGPAVIISVLFLVQTFASVVVSDAGFDEMDICQDSGSTPYELGGICDDRTDGHDGTTDGTDWVEGMFHFNMTSPTEIQFQASWAIREWDKAGMGLFNSVSMSNVLRDDNIMANDGLPADVLRSAFDENTDPNDAGSPTIQESLLTEIDDSISSFLSGWGGSSTPDTNWISDRIFLPDDSGTMAGVDCELDPLQDSDGNAFEPPICISTNVNITLPISTTYGLEGGVSASGLDSALEGLLVMGSQITTNFDVKVNSGHKGSYAIQPPPYATVVKAGGWVGEEIEEVDGGGVPYKSGLWSIDNRANPNGVLQADLDMTMGYRDNDGTDVVSVSPLDKSMDLMVTVDLSDENNSFVEVMVGIYQIQSSSLTSWGIEPLMDTATIPVITSDGIRMAYHTGLLELEDLSSKIPVSGIGQALASSNEGLSVAMGGFTWTSAVTQAPLDPGGLNHTHGFGCSRGMHYCLEGTVAMDDTYPVYMRSVSHTFPLSLADLLGGNLGDSGFMNSVSGDDLNKLLNSGLQFSTVLSDDAIESFIGDLLPNGISADLTMTIVLPTWASTFGGGDSIVLTYRADGNHDGALSITGSESFSWEHAICRTTAASNCADQTPDVVCASTSKSCGYLDVDFDLGKVSFASLPLTKGGYVEFALSVDLTIHRIGVPAALFEAVNSGSTSINLEVLPADLLRAFLDIGKRGDPLEVEWEICDDGKSYCDQKISFSSDEASGLPAYADSLSKDIESLLRDASKAATDNKGNGIGTVDMSGLTVDIQLPSDMLTDNDDSIGDENGIVLSVDIPKVRIETGVSNSWFELIGILRGGEGDVEIGIKTTDLSNALVAPFLDPMVSAMGGLTDALSASMVSAEGIRTPKAMSFSVPTSQLVGVGPSEMGLDLQGFITVTLPAGIQLEDYSSSNGKLTVVEENGTKRQIVSYEIGPSMNDDKVEFKVLLTPLWVFQQVQLYLIGVILFSLWRVRRRMTRRKRRRRAAALEALEESAASPLGYIPPQPTVEVLQVSDNGIVIKRRLVAT